MTSSGQPSGGAVANLRDRISQAIIAGEIEASTGLTQDQLARLFNVSRTPLREALRMLELEHLVVRGDNGRFRAADLSAAEIEQLGITAIVLEATAVRLTIPTLTTGDDARLEGFLAESLRLAEVGEWGAYDRSHHDLHMLLAGEVGPMHAEQLSRLWEQANRYRRAFASVANSDGHDTITQHEHRRIVDAAQARDADATVRLAAEHQAAAIRAIAAQLEPGYETVRLDVTLDVVVGTPAQPTAA